MKIIKAIFLLAVALVASSSHGEIKILNFSDGDNSFSAFESAGVKLEPFKNISYLKTFEGGTYRILLPGNATFTLELERGEVRSGLDEDDYATTIKLFSRKLSLEASKRLSYFFHENFNLPTNQLDEWFVELENGEAYSAYAGGGLSYNFPFLAMSLRTSFDPLQPAFAIFSISWDEKFSKKSGRTLSSNQKLNVSYDMPELLKGIPEFTEVAEVKPVIVKVGQPNPVIEETTAPEPAIEKEPAEVIVTEPVEEDIEQSSNWWPWFIGILVIVGVLGLVVRRKN